MGDKETFSSELDRLIWPFIEFWDEHNKLDEATARYRDDDTEKEDPIGGTWRAQINASLRIDWTMFEDEGPSFWEVHWNDTIVYQRRDGRTLAFRAGWEWIDQLLRHTLAFKGDREVAEIRDIYERHIGRAPDFAPLV